MHYYNVLTTTPFHKQNDHTFNQNISLGKVHITE